MAKVFYVLLFYVKSVTVASAPLFCRLVVVLNKLQLSEPIMACSLQGSVTTQRLCNYDEIVQKKSPRTRRKCFIDVVENLCDEDGTLTTLTRKAVGSCNYRLLTLFERTHLGEDRYTDEIK